MIIYRVAGESDIVGMAKIRAAEWGEEEYWCIRIGRYMRGEHHPQKSLKPRIVYVASEDALVVGFIAGHLTKRYECDGELEWINVISSHRQTGIASKLLYLLGGWFVEQNAFRICVDVDPNNITARNFYMKHGATELNRHWLVWNDIKRIL